MSNILKLLIGFFILISISGFAQYYSTGQDPASIRWRQIKTKSYQLIYPGGDEARAQRLAMVMDLVVRHETTTLKANVPRIPVILHTASVISNGVTVWAPRRIELYPQQPVQGYPEEWLEQLAIHEYRHAVQISSVNRGFTKALSYILGEQITGGILGLYLPSWFLEGDATVTETALSSTGRGRSGLFESSLRAQLLEKGKFSYDKATLGSYKTFVPDAYSLGYYLVAQSRARYGAGVWDAAISRIGKYPFMLVPFSSGIRKTTGLWKSQLYKQVMDDLDSAWKAQALQTRVTQVHHVTRENSSDYTDYHQPHYHEKGDIVAEKTSIDDVPRICRIDRATGKEMKLVTPGIRLERTSSLSGNYLVWAELRYDHRWQNQSYSEIRMLDISTGKTRYLTHHSRYFSPALNQDGTRIAVIENNDFNEHSIVILDATSGDVIQRTTLPGNQVAMNPAWDQGRILFTLQESAGQTIAAFYPQNNRIQVMMPFSYREINGKPMRWDKKIIFSSCYHGIENLYALDTVTNRVLQVTSARYAATGVSQEVWKDNLLYTDYTAGGAMVSEIKPDSTQWVPVNKLSDHSLKLYETMALQEKVNIQDSMLHRQTAVYPSKKYSKAGHLFNIHSWAPVTFSAENLDFNPGVMVLSQNVLNSMFANAGWEYDMNEETGKFYAGISYQGLYPVIDLKADYGNRSGYARYSDTSESFRFLWRETNLKFQVSIPWNFSRGRWVRTLEPRLGTTLIGVGHLESTPEQLFAGWITSLDYRVYASQYQRMSGRDLYPRIGQTIDVNFRHTPFGINDMGSIFATAGRFYLPSVFRHHSLNIYAGYQQYLQKEPIFYSYSNLIRIPRGYHGISDEYLFTAQINYAFPFWYPDLSLGSLFYFKRLKMNLFYDFTRGMEQKVFSDYISTGAELTADLHILRFLAPVELGIRTMIFPTTSTWSWEFLYAIGLP